MPQYLPNTTISLPVSGAPRPEMRSCASTGLMSVQPGPKASSHRSLRARKFSPYIRLGQHITGSASSSGSTEHAPSVGLMHLSPTKGHCRPETEGVAAGSSGVNPKNSAIFKAMDVEIHVSSSASIDILFGTLCRQWMAGGLPQHLELGGSFGGEVERVNPFLYRT